MAVRRLITFPEKIKPEHKPVRLPFLYKGSYEYIRIFRQSFWGLYPTLSFCNRRNRTRKYKNKQSMSHTMGIGTGIRLSANNGQQISSSFQNFKTLCLFQLKSIAWNVFITSIPFSLTLIASTYDQDEILFFLSYYTATLIYAIGIGMLRHIIPSPLLLFIVQLSILMPFYLGSLFVPIILIPGIALTALLTCHAHKRLKRLL